MNSNNNVQGETGVPMSRSYSPETMITTNVLDDNVLSQVLTNFTSDDVKIDETASRTTDDVFPQRIHDVLAQQSKDVTLCGATHCPLELLQKKFTKPKISGLFDYKKLAGATMPDGFGKLRKKYIFEKDGQLVNSKGTNLFAIPDKQQPTLALKPNMDVIDVSGYPRVEFAEGQIGSYQMKQIFRYRESVIKISNDHKSYDQFIAMLAKKPEESIKALDTIKQYYGQDPVLLQFINKCLRKLRNKKVPRHFGKAWRVKEWKRLSAQVEEQMEVGEAEIKFDFSLKMPQLDPLVRSFQAVAGQVENFGNQSHWGAAIEILASVIKCFLCAKYVPGGIARTVWIMAEIAYFSSVALRFCGFDLAEKFVNKMKSLLTVLFEKFGNQDPAVEAIAQQQEEADIAAEQQGAQNVQSTSAGPDPVPYIEEYDSYSNCRPYRNFKCQLCKIRPSAVYCNQCESWRCHICAYKMHFETDDHKAIYPGHNLDLCELEAYNVLEGMTKTRIEAGQMYANQVDLQNLYNRGNFTLNLFWNTWWHKLQPEDQVAWVLTWDSMSITDEPLAHDIGSQGDECEAYVVKPNEPKVGGSTAAKPMSTGKIPANEAHECLLDPSEETPKTSYASAVSSAGTSQISSGLVVDLPPITSTGSITEPISPQPKEFKPSFRPEDMIPVSFDYEVKKQNEFLKTNRKVFRPQIPRPPPLPYGMSQLSLPAISENEVLSSEAPIVPQPPVAVRTDSNSSDEEPFDTPPNGVVEIEEGDVEVGPATMLSSSEFGDLNLFGTMMHFMKGVFVAQDVALTMNEVNMVKRLDRASKGFRSIATMGSYVVGGTHKVLSYCSTMLKPDTEQEKQAREWVDMSRTYGAYYVENDVLVKRSANVTKDRNILRTLLVEGYKLEVFFSTHGQRAIWKDEMKKLVDGLSKISTYLFGANAKVKPLTMYVYGKAGIGKSTFVDTFAKYMFDLIELGEYIPSVHKYSQARNTEYWEGYYGQPLCVIDDFAVVHEEQALIKEFSNFLSLATETECNLNFAHLDDKGQHKFTSDIIVLTSNTIPTNAITKYITDPNAFYRRVDFACRPIPNKEIMTGERIDPLKIGEGISFKNFQFQLTAPGTNMHKFVTFDELLIHCTKIYKNNCKRQAADIKADTELIDKIKAAVAKAEVLPSGQYAPIVWTEVGASRSEADYFPTHVQLPDKKPLYRLVWDEFLYRTGYSQSSTFEQIRKIVFTTKHTMILAVLAAVGWLAWQAWNHFSKVTRTIFGKLLWWGGSKEKETFSYVDEPVESGVGEHAHECEDCGDHFTHVTTKACAEKSCPDCKLSLLTTVKGKSEVYDQKMSKPTKVIVGKVEGEIKNQLEGDDEMTEFIAPSADSNVLNSMRKVSHNMITVSRNADGTRMSLHGVIYKGHIAMVPEHFFRVKYEESYEITVGSVVTTDFKIRVKHLDIVKDSKNDVACFQLPLRYIAPFADISKHFILGSDGKKKYERGLTLKLVREKGDMWRQIYTARDIQAMGIGVELSLPGGERTELITEGWCYNTDSEVGDCGMLLFTCDKDTPRKIIGMHIGSTHTNPSKRASYLTREKLDALAGQFNTIVPNFHEEGKAEVLTEFVGAQQLGTVAMPYNANKSNIIKSIAFNKYRKTTREPAVLRSKMKGGEYVDVLSIPMKYMSQIQQVFEGDEIVDAAINDTLAELRSVSVNSKIVPRLLTEDEMLNGYRDDYGNVLDCYSRIDETTSPGYPYVTQPRKQTGKKDWITNDGGHLTMSESLRESIAQREESAAINEPLFTPVIAKTKDELRPIGKGIAPRLFDISPMCLNLLVRKYFGAYCATVIENHILGECSVGINPYNEEWTLMFQDLTKIEPDHLYFIFGDYKKWDKSLTFQICMWFCELVNKWYNDGNNKIREALCASIFSSLKIVEQDGENIVYRFFKMMTSGVAFTAVGNSGINSIFTRVVFYIICRDNDISLSKARELQAKHVMKNFGDDHVIKATAEEYNFYNMRTIQTCLKKYFNIDYTAADKGDTIQEVGGVEELTYLKRGFVKSGSRWLAPLDEAVLDDMLNWQQKGQDPSDALIDSARSLQVEFTQYPREYYEARSDEIQVVLSNCGVMWTPTGYTEMAVRMGELGNIWRRTTPRAYVDDMIDHSINLEKHHIMNVEKNIANTVTKIEWCPAYLNVTHAKGKKLLAHHKCDECKRIVVHKFFSERNRICLPCAGLNNVPEGYFHGPCDICKSSAVPMVSDKPQNTVLRRLDLKGNNYLVVSKDERPVGSDQQKALGSGIRDINVFPDLKQNVAKTNQTQSNQTKQTKQTTQYVETGIAQVGEAENATANKTVLDKVVSGFKHTAKFFTGIPMVVEAVRGMSMLALDRYTEDRTTTPFAISSYGNTSKGQGVYPGYDLSVRGESDVGDVEQYFDTKRSDYLFNNLIKTPGFLFRKLLEDSDVEGQIVQRFKVHPLEIPVIDAPTGQRMYNTPLSYNASIFKLWRGTIVYKFVFVCTTMHTARYRITYVASDLKGAVPTQIDLTTCPNTIVDVNGLTTLVFTVPWTQPELYKFTNKPIGENANGEIIISVVNPITSSGSTTITPFYLFCFVAAGDTFQMCQPTPNLKSIIYPPPPTLTDSGIAEVGEASGGSELEPTLTNPPTEVHGGQSANELPAVQKSFVQMVEKVGAIEGHSTGGALSRSIAAGSPVKQPSLEDFLQLPFPIKSGTITANTEGLFDTISLPADIFSIPQVWEKLQNVWMIRFDLEVNVKFNVSPFQYGYVRIVHFPLGEGIDNTEFPGFTDAHMNLPTMMQMKGVDVYFPAQNNGSFIVPWNIPVPWLKLSGLDNKEYNISEMARIKMFIAAPLASANGTTQPVNYTIFVRILNPQWTNMIPKTGNFIQPNLHPTTEITWPATILLSESSIFLPAEQGRAEIGTDLEFVVNAKEVIEDSTVNAEVFPSFLHLCQRPQEVFRLNTGDKIQKSVDIYVPAHNAMSTYMAYFSRMFRYQRGSFGLYAIANKGGDLIFNKNARATLNSNLLVFTIAGGNPAKFDSNCVIYPNSVDRYAFASVPYQSQIFALPFDDCSTTEYADTYHNFIEVYVGSTFGNVDTILAIAAKDDWAPQYWIGAPLNTVLNEQFLIDKLTP